MLDEFTEKNLRRRTLTAQRSNHVACQWWEGHPDRRIILRKSSKAMIYRIYFIFCLHIL